MNLRNLSCDKNYPGRPPRGRHVAALALAGAFTALSGAAPVLAQSRGPVTVNNAFDPDLPDIKPPAGREISDAVSAAPSAAEVQAVVPQNAPSGCYPPLTRARVVMLGKAGSGEFAGPDPALRGDTRRGAFGAPFSTPPCSP